MWRLQDALGEIAGLPHVSLQPSAGSHGELAGVLLTRAYHEDRGEQRTKVLTPDTAHGTNPATVTMAGYEVVKVGTDDQGNVDLDDLRAKADEDVACLMLTNPSTLGLFEHGIEEIARDRPRRRRHPVLRRRQPQRDHGHLPPRRHGLRHRALQPAQVLHPAARRRRARCGADRGLRPDRAVSAAAPGRSRTDPTHPQRSRAGCRLRPRLRPPQVDRPPARLPGQLRRVRPLLRLHPLARRRRAARRLRDGGAQRQLPARQAPRRGSAGAPARPPTSDCACTSSCSPAHP